MKILLRLPDERCGLGDSIEVPTVGSQILVVANCEPRSASSIAFRVTLGTECGAPGWRADAPLPMASNSSDAVRCRSGNCLERVSFHHLVDTGQKDAFERLGTSSSLSRVIADKACLLADSYERMLEERRHETLC